VNAEPLILQMKYTDIVKGFGDNITYKQLTLFDDFQIGKI